MFWHMKTSISHLPKNKQSELKKIVSTICDLAKVEMIILFGSYARGAYREAQDVIPNKPGFRRISDYDILVITEKKNQSLWHKISSKCQKLKLSAPVKKVEAHDIEMLNIKLAEGQYFFSDIKKEGIMLYDSKRFTLAKKRKLKPQEKRRIAKDYFARWFKTAEMFFEDFYDCLRKAKNDEEYLKKVFPQKTREQKARFELLDEAYIGGRYDADFYMAKEDLEILTKDVKKLLAITEKICQQKLDNLTLTVKTA